MTDTEDKLDEFGNQYFSVLKPAPPMTAEAASEVKKAFLQAGESYRLASLNASSNRLLRTPMVKRGSQWYFQHKLVVRLMLIGLIAFAFLLIGSTITVSAAQNSQPGEALYKIKTWSEDVSLEAASSPQARLDLVLKYTNRRMDEISGLLTHGKAIDSGISDRFQSELDDALNLAAQLDDSKIQAALIQIKAHAESQGMIIHHLSSYMPPLEEPAIHLLQDRLTEQVQISNLGETNPNEFRLKVRGLQKGRDKHFNQTQEPGSSHPGNNGTPPGQEKNNQENGNSLPTQAPSQNGSGNGNHVKNPTHTPKP